MHRGRSQMLVHTWRGYPLGRKRQETGSSSIGRLDECIFSLKHQDSPRGLYHVQPDKLVGLGSTNDWRTA